MVADFNSLTESIKIDLSLLKERIIEWWKKDV